MQKKKRLSFIIAVMMVFAIFCAVPSATAASQLSDVSGHWAEVQIQCVVDQGIATGYPDQTFKPTNAITRAEFITMANRAFSFTETADINYSDVAAGDWYATEIAKAKAAGYIAGYEDGTMKPNAEISRQEVAKIMATILKLDISNGVIEYFTDAEAIPAWSKDFISAMVKAAYMNGYPDGSFQPAKSINRAEAAVIFCRAKNVQTFTQTLIDKAGTYGPEIGTRTIENNVAIKAGDVTLQNVMIEGDLLIDAGDGDVNLKNVTVTGTTTIKSAGSVNLDHCIINKMIVNDPDGKVDVILANDSQVRTMQLDSAASVSGTGIGAAVINATGVTIATPPASTTVKSGLSASVGGKTVYGSGGGSSSGGGGGGTVIPLPTITNATLNGTAAAVSGNTLTFSVIPGTAYTTGAATLNVNANYNITSGAYNINGTATTTENLLASALALLDNNGGTSGDGVLGSTLLANSPVTITLTAAADASKVNTYTIQFVSGVVAPTLSNVTVGGISPTISGNTLEFAVAPATAYNAGTATLSGDASYRIQGGTYDVTGTAVTTDNLMNIALGVFATAGGGSGDVLGSTLIANSPVTITLAAASDASKTTVYTVNFVSNAVAPTLSNVTVGGVSPTISGNTLTFEVVSATAYNTGTATLSGDASYRIQGGTYDVTGTAVTTDNLMNTALSVFATAGGGAGDVLGSTLIANSPVTITLAAAGDASKTTVYTVNFAAYVPPTEITAFDAIADVAAGTAGSAAYADAAAVIAALPTTVTANSNAVTVPVTVWVDTDTYNPAVAGSYTFTATLGAIPAGYANSGNYTAAVEVVVVPAPPTEITAFDAIADVDAGTTAAPAYADAAAVIAALPATATANANAVTVPVTWVDTDTYNPAVAGSYTFTATLGAIPAGYANSGNFTATVEVVVSTPAPVSVVVNTLGVEGDLTTADPNVYYIEAPLGGLRSFGIRVDRLPAAFAGATGYKMVIDSTEYTMAVNMFNSSIYQYDFLDTITADQIRNGSLVAIF